MQPTVNNQYHIVLPNEKAAIYRTVTFIIALVNAAGFALFYFRETEPGRQLAVTLGAIVSIIAFIFYLLQLFRKTLLTFRIEISFVLSALLWFFYGNLWLGFLLLLFAIFGFYSNTALLVHFSEEGIVYPSFPVKKIAWAQVDFVMLKDSVLTIELKDNHLYQFTLDKEVAEKIPEAAFNEFCSRCTKG